MPSPRRTILVLGSLTAGLVVNLAVAVGCALWSPAGENLDVVPLGDEHRDVIPLGDLHCGGYRRGFGVTLGYFCVRWRPQSTFDGQPIQRGSIFDLFSIVSPMDGDSISAMPKLADSALVSFSPASIGAGWPLRCLHGDDPARASPIFGVSHARSIHTPKVLQASGGGGPMGGMAGRPWIPADPVWSGMDVNTLLYGFAIWLPVTTWGQVRRARRVRGGRCPACAYPFGTSPTCSECGHDLARWVCTVEP